MVNWVWYCDSVLAVGAYLCAGTNLSYLLSITRDLLLSASIVVILMLPLVGLAIMSGRKPKLAVVCLVILFLTLALIVILL